jgi:hypothetical protein
MIESPERAKDQRGGFALSGLDDKPSHSGGGALLTTGY